MNTEFTGYWPGCRCPAQYFGRAARSTTNSGILTYVDHYDAGSAPEWVEPVHVAQPAP